MGKKQHLVIIDILTLLATILVVMGHHKFLRESISWYPTYDKIIYSFHMGFFMTISGFLIKYTFPENCSWKNYVWKKVKKFVPAYFAVGLLAALITFKSFESFVNDIILLIVNPSQGPIQIIWYIYILLLYYCLAPLIFRLSSKQRWWLLFFSIIPALLYQHLPTYFNLLHFFRLLPFFLLGTHLADNLNLIQKIADWKIFLLGVPFILFIIICIILQDNPLKGGIGRLISSTLSLPLMYWTARKLAHNSFLANVSTLFSPYVYPVYLWQMFFINIIWLIWQKSHWTLNDATAVAYIVCSVTITISGIVLMFKAWRWCSKTVLTLFKNNLKSH